MQNRRNFIRSLAMASTTAVFSNSVFAIPKHADQKQHQITFGIISDLHHLQFGVKEEQRFKGFMDDVVKRSPSFIIQNGDFCRPTGSDEIMNQWNRFKGPKYHVLGNHDMDVCSKETIMKFWGMEKKYYSFDNGGYHFIVMDRNFYRNDDGSLMDYNTSNWGPVSEKRSFSDKEQLNWLKADLANAKDPVVIFMHQPVYISDFFREIGNSEEILAMFDEANYQADKNKRSSKIIAVFMGHDHVDRYGERNGVHYFIVNSASYAYSGDAYYYRDPLYAFVTLDPKGRLIMEGRSTIYKTEPPDKIKAVFSSRISNHDFNI